MGRFTIGTAVVLVLAGTVAFGQMEITSAEEYAKLMSSNAEAVVAIDIALTSGEVADARAQIPTLRESYMTLETFWTERKRDDAITLIKDGLMRLDALDKMFGMAGIERQEAKAEVKEFRDNTCLACHQAYRLGSLAEGFRFRDGVF